MTGGSVKDDPAGRAAVMTGGSVKVMIRPGGLP